MGTFHHDKGELHGITVVVHTHGGGVYVGRCDTVNQQGVLLWDADQHHEGKDGRSIAEFLRAAAQWGHWPRLPQVTIPASEVAEVTRLKELRDTGGNAPT
jgi:hypothetical protein